jgi:AcrR family transcriptional regulator
MIEQKAPRRTQAERSKASRGKIIHEATRLFGQYGFHGAKLSEIAKAVDMTEPGLLHHFPSKEHLLMGVLEERDRVNDEQYGVNRHENGWETLDALQALVAHNETVPGLVQLFTVLVTESISPDQPGHEFFVNRYRSIREQSTAVLKQSQQAGEIRSDIDPEALAVMVFALMDGLQIQWLLEPDKVSMSKAFDLYIRILKETLHPHHD